MARNIENVFVLLQFTSRVYSQNDHELHEVPDRMYVHLMFRAFRKEISYKGLESRKIFKGMFPILNFSS